jgi:hypothetical protein
MDLVEAVDNGFSTNRPVVGRTSPTQYGSILQFDILMDTDCLQQKVQQLADTKYLTVIWAELRR